MQDRINQVDETFAPCSSDQPGGAVHSHVRSRARKDPANRIPYRGVADISARNRSPAARRSLSVFSVNGHYRDSSACLKGAMRRQRLRSERSSMILIWIRWISSKPLPLPVDQVIKLRMPVSDFWTRHPLLSTPLVDDGS
jgi:hypothetical protein